MKIDAHQHFWIFDPVRDSWIDETMHTIRRNFLPADVKALLSNHRIDGCVAVQADQSEDETDFLLASARQHEFIKGVVGWIDLQSPELDSRLDYYRSFEKLKGFRHILQGKFDQALMLKPAFRKGVGQLQLYNFTYDILIHAEQLRYIPEFVKAFPDQKFVIDHLAKPDIKNQRTEDWAKHIRLVSQFDNVWCKVSGMVTEADWKNWKAEDFTPYLDIVFDAFGTQRTMYGSDWPVCNLAGGYDQAIGLMQNYTSRLSADEQADFWGNTAADFYRLT